MSQTLFFAVAFIEFWRILDKALNWNFILFTLSSTTILLGFINTDFLPKILWPKYLETALAVSRAICGVSTVLIFAVHPSCVCKNVFRFGTFLGERENIWNVAKQRDF